ncbi:MAG: AAA family ATPase [Arcobacter sp.]|uniref:AAA family ATPase n=1 Tax=Arcobacter sp. TaxID=1872629 RepID=UPI003CFE61A2
MIYKDFYDLIRKTVTAFNAKYEGKSFNDFYENTSLENIYNDLVSNTGIVKDDESKKTLINFFSILKRDIEKNKSFQFYKDKIDTINYPLKNLLLKGVPGTGKSYIINEIIKKDLELKNKPENVLRINIHTASSNADLMQGIAITTELNQVAYKEKQGLIFEHIRKACFSPYEPFVLVLEEIQENSLNELIGDLIYLCEDKKRAKIQELNSSIFTQDEYEYQKLIELYLENLDNPHFVEIPNLVSNGENRKLIMPDNLFIFCTSNYRDDKKVIEDNLLRRFDVIEVYPQYKDGFVSDDVSEFLDDLNNKIHTIFEKQHETHPDRFLIGHANWLDVEKIGDDKFYKSLLKVVVEFKEIREVDYKIIAKLFEDLKTKYKLEIEYGDYKSLVNSLQKKVYSDILNRNEPKQDEQSSSQE